jgi:peptide/nickel transport system substrate-binding protein
MTRQRCGAALGAFLILFAAGCGGSSSKSSGGGAASTASTPGGGNRAATDSGPPVKGGTLRAGIVDNPDHLDSGLSYTNEGWEILEATNNGLLTFKKAAGGEGATIAPDIAEAMPTVSDDGLTFTFKLRPNVMFSAPVSRPVRASDFKFTVERLFRIDSGGVGFYSAIAGATKYAKTRKGGISGIVADDAKRTITFHLTQRDGTFLEYMAMPFTFAVPKGAPDKDISTLAPWRVATGPYRISEYVPKDHITIVRNPSFHSWTADTPDGNLDKIQVQIGVTPEQAVNEVADGSLDFYFQQVAPDRLTEIKARYPNQVYNYSRNNVTFFTLNSRKPPMNDARVRKALNFAVDRQALLKIFGGQGVPTENIVPPGLGSAYAKHNFYPHDPAKAKALVAQSGTKGMAVQVWASNTDPQPKAAQYMASVLNSLGYKATVKTLDEGVYYDTVGSQKGDPQVSYNDWNQDFPEGEDFLDTMFDGEKITNVGNKDGSNLNEPSVNKALDAARAMPLGDARNAAWAKIDAQVMGDYAPDVPFLTRGFPKFSSAKVHGLVFNGTYFEMFPSMWLAK